MDVCLSVFVDDHIIIVTVVFIIKGHFRRGRPSRPVYRQLLFGLTLVLLVLSVITMVVTDGTSHLCDDTLYFACECFQTVLEGLL